MPNPDLQLKPGMTANVAITIARADDVLKVPNAALRFRPDAATLEAHGQRRRRSRPGSAARERAGRPHQVPHPASARPSRGVLGADGDA